MPDRERRDHSLEIAFDHYWNTVLAGAAELSSEAIDPDLVATVQRMHALDVAPPLSPTFAATLWEDLMSARTLVPTIVVQPSAQLQAHPMPAPSPWAIPTVRPPMSRIAAAILIIALLAGSAFAALYPLGHRNGQRLSLFAPSGSPTAEPAPTPRAALLDLTLSDIAPFEAEGGIAVTTYPPGGSSRERAAGMTEVLYIATGPMTVQAEEAPDPVHIIPSGTMGPTPSTSQLSVGEKRTLSAGTTLVAPPGTIITLRNEGISPTTMLDLLWASASTSTEAGGARWTRGWGGKRQDLALPVSIDLQQITLLGGESLPTPDSDNTSQAAATVDPNREPDLLPMADGSLRNGGDDPLEVYVLTVVNETVTAATPADATAQVSAVFESLWEFPGDPNAQTRFYGLGIDPEGNLWASDANHDRFEIIAPDGTQVETWGTPGTEEGEFEFHASESGFGRAYGDVAFDGAGNIFVLDTGNFRVQKFALDHSFLLAWGSEGTGDGQFVAPGGIAVGSDGVVYVSDERRGDIQKFGADGQFLGTIGEVGTDDGQFVLPAGVAIGGAGDVWVADWSGHRIERFSASGAFIDSWGTAGNVAGALNNPNDVAVDNLGHVYVADDHNGRLQVFTPDGEFLAKIGGDGSDPPVFSGVLGVAVNEDGVVYVSDNSRVQAFRLMLP